MSYKRLGNYISQVNNRNKGIITEDLRGLSMIKEFRKSTSNIVGTDLSKYKLVGKNQFACDFMSVIRVHKLPVVLHTEDKPVIVSPAYTVFEVINEDVLLPEYVMMWFRRAEFDRYADFRCDSAIRGGFKWNELCDVELPIPDIKQQRAIVKEYNTVVNRIQLNEAINENLEATTQVLYKHWFVDFEFPNANNKPYKSSGGKIVYNTILGKNIPSDENWSTIQISSFCKVTSSKRIFEREYVDSGIPFYRAGEIRDKKRGKPVKFSLYISEKRFSEINNKYGYPKEGDILITAVGSRLGDSYLVEKENFYFKDGNIIWFKNFKRKNLNMFLYCFLNSNHFNEFLSEIKIGSGQTAITIKDLSNKFMLIPSTSILKIFVERIEIIYKKISLKKRETLILYSLKDFLLSKMSKVNAPKEAV